MHQRVIPEINLVLDLCRRHHQTMSIVNVLTGGSDDEFS